jgi:hypothetical protein
VLADDNGVLDDVNARLTKLHEHLSDTSDLRVLLAAGIVEEAMSGPRSKTHYDLVREVSGKTSRMSLVEYIQWMDPGGQGPAAEVEEWVERIIKLCNGD